MTLTSKLGVLVFALVVPALAPAQASADGPAAAKVPGWRQGMLVGHVYDIPGTENLPAVLGAELASNVVDGWGAFAASATELWMTGGGHGEWRQPVCSIDLASDTPKWKLANRGSAKDAVTMDGPYYTDGLPVSRHTYYTVQYLSARHARDGKARLMLFGSSAAYATGTPGKFDHGPQVDGFRLDDAKWDAAGTWEVMPYTDYYPAVARDPRNGDVYMAAGDSTKGNRLLHWSAATGKFSRLMTTPIYPDKGRMHTWVRAPALVDPVRNRVVALLASELQSVDLASGAVTNTTLSGDFTRGHAQGRGFVYDPDNDRYVLFDYTGYPATSAAAYAIDPRNGATKLIAEVRPPKASVEGRAAYVPALHGIAYLARSDSPVQFLPTRDPR
jgi:hypothetical protein